MPWKSWNEREVFSSLHQVDNILPLVDPKASSVENMELDEDQQKVSQICPVANSWPSEVHRTPS